MASFSDIHDRLHNRRFTVANNSQGLSGNGTVFHYLVDDGAITSTYHGGRIRVGNQVGRVTGRNTIELLYHCMTTEGEILAGWSRGEIGLDNTRPEAACRLCETWSNTNAYLTIKENIQDE